MEKLFYTKKECMELGLSRRALERAALVGWPVVIKEAGKTSPYKFNFEELMKYFKKNTQLWEGKNK